MASFPSGDVVIAGIAETPYTRRSSQATTDLLAEAALSALRDADIPAHAVDGLGVASFSLAPDRAIDLAWRLGLRLRWVMDDATGGASALNLLAHARRAIAAADARCILLLAGDRLDPADMRRLTDEFNVATRELLAPLPFGGPNTLFALLTQRHMQAYGLGRDTYGGVAVAQRVWATRNPGAVYRAPMRIEDYLASPMIVPPLTRLDCVPVVAGADAVLVTAGDVSRRRPVVTVRALAARHNATHQEGDGLTTGLAELAGELGRVAGIHPSDVDVIGVYDDYTVMVLVQLRDLGVIPDDDFERFVRVELLERARAVNTSGGQLSAGQAGAAGSMHGLVEAARQLRGEAGERQVAGARTALVTGYGMVLYRYGAAANAAILERAG